MPAGSSFEPRSRARRRALQALYQWQITGQQAGEIVAQFRAAQDMKGVDDAYFEELLRGIVAGQEGLDAELEPFLDRPLGQVDLMERVVLRIGAYELLNRPELPCRVVLDECVDLAHRFGSEQGHSFVNAVLDRAARQWRSAEFGGPGEG
jgi:N utilization substance protein B